MEGNAIAIGTTDSAGQFIFFNSDGLAALSNYHQGLFIEYASPYNHAYPLTYMTDGNVVSIDDYNGPYEFFNVFTINKFGSKEQIWEKVYLHSQQNPKFSIQKRIVVHLRETGRK
jgi:hypothetical protein